MGMRKEVFRKFRREDGWSEGDVVTCVAVAPRGKRFYKVGETYTLVPYHPMGYLVLMELGSKNGHSGVFELAEEEEQWE